MALLSIDLFTKTSSIALEVLEGHDRSGER